MRRNDNRDAALVVQTAQQGRDFELVAEVERRRRFVQQQDPRGLGVNLGERSGNHHALFFTAAERCEQSLLQPAGAGGLERLLHDREIQRALRLEWPEMRKRPIIATSSTV